MICTASYVYYHKFDINKGENDDIHEVRVKYSTGTGTASATLVTLVTDDW